MDKSPDAFRTISEVADWLDTPAHVLRFWESRFTQVKPVKRAGGRRYYRPADMALLGGIKKLLHEDGMTIRGVQKLLREKGVKYVASFAGEMETQVEAPMGGASEGIDSPASEMIPDAPMALDVPEGAFDTPIAEENTVVQFARPDEPMAQESQADAGLAPDAPQNFATAPLDVSAEATADEMGETADPVAEDGIAPDTAQTEAAPIENAAADTAPVEEFAPSAEPMAEEFAAPEAPLDEAPAFAEPEAESTPIPEPTPEPIVEPAAESEADAPQAGVKAEPTQAPAAAPVQAPVVQSAFDFGFDSPAPEVEAEVEVEPEATAQATPELPAADPVETAPMAVEPVEAEPSVELETPEPLEMAPAEEPVPAAETLPDIENLPPAMDLPTAEEEPVQAASFEAEMPAADEPALAEIESAPLEESFAAPEPLETPETFETAEPLETAETFEADEPLEISEPASFVEPVSEPEMTAPDEIAAPLEPVFDAAEAAPDISDESPAIDLDLPQDGSFDTEEFAQPEAAEFAPEMPSEPAPLEEAFEDAAVESELAAPAVPEPVMGDMDSAQDHHILTEGLDAPEISETTTLPIQADVAADPADDAPECDASGISCIGHLSRSQLSAIDPALQAALLSRAEALHQQITAG